MVQLLEVPVKIQKKLKQNLAQSTCAESTHRGVNWCLKDVIQLQAQQQRPESPIITLTWYACKVNFKVHKPTKGTCYIII